MEDYGGWEILGQLGEGGQSTVSLVRSPERVEERRSCVNEMSESRLLNQDAKFAESAWKYARPEDISELGALKHFKITGALSTADRSEAIGRLKNEIAFLERGRPGLPRLLAKSLEDSWLVTEYFPEGSLSRHMQIYTGKVVKALPAFRSLVCTASVIHNEGYVHRDIKPANIFLKNEQQLILGDFGIVYAPDESTRLTTLTERVGPRDFMPPWADTGHRLNNVTPSFDVYMLGKLLWCMISGQPKLPREWHRKQEHNLEVLFPGDPDMPIVNRLLDRCLVEDETKCLRSAGELLPLLDDSIIEIHRGGAMLDANGRFCHPCRICGKGDYRMVYDNVTARKTEGYISQDVRFHVFVCSVCGHYEFFVPGFPNEAASRGWKATL